MSSVPRHSSEQSLLHDFNEKDNELQHHSGLEYTSNNVYLRLPFMPKLPTRSSLHIVRGKAFSEFCKKLSFFMLPSFVQSKIRGRTAQQQNPHPTAFLDGMRGVAAFLVMICHNTYNHYDIFYGYGAGGNGQNLELYKLPFIRIVYQGATMVAVFFVISGYALSYKPVKLMRNKNWQSLSQSLGSSIFRRAMRLYLPCIVSTFFVSIIIWAGCYNMGADYARSNGQYNTGHNVNEPKSDFLSKQLLYWVQETSTKLINPWSFVPNDFIPVIDGHLWTIPIEYVMIPYRLRGP